MTIIIPAYAEMESCNGQSHIKYNIENGKVKDCIIHKYTHSIIVNFQTESDGQLTVEIPRSIGFDYMCANEKIFIIVDGQEVKFNEEYSAFSRTFIVPFEHGNTQMEIVDSLVIDGPYPDISICVAEHSPIEQIRNNVSVDEIRCNLGFVLLEKKSDSSAACVTPSAAEILVVRGWGTQIYHQESSKITTDSGVQYVNYKIRNGLVENIILYDQASTVIVEMNSTDNGKIIITIPRTVIDARLGPDGMYGQDDRFFVLIDGIEASFTEKKDYLFRELTILFENNSKEIEIIGTKSLS